MARPATLENGRCSGHLPRQGLLLGPSTAFPHLVAHSKTWKHVLLYAAQLMVMRGSLVKSLICVTELVRAAHGQQLHRVQMRACPSALSAVKIRLPTCHASCKHHAVLMWGSQRARVVALLELHGTLAAPAVAAVAEGVLPPPANAVVTEPFWMQGSGCTSRQRCLALLACAGTAAPTQQESSFARRIEHRWLQLPAQHIAPIASLLYIVGWLLVATLPDISCCQMTDGCASQKKKSTTNYCRNRNCTMVCMCTGCVSQGPFRL